MNCYSVIKRYYSRYYTAMFCYVPICSSRGEGERWENIELGLYPNLETFETIYKECDRSEKKERNKKREVYIASEKWRSGQLITGLRHKNRCCERVKAINNMSDRKCWCCVCRTFPITNIAVIKLFAVRLSESWAISYRCCKTFRAKILLNRFRWNLEDRDVVSL